MARALSATAAYRLKEAVTAVRRWQSEGRTAAWIIAKLKDHFGAKTGDAGGTYTLRCCGVVSSCTWPRENGLLNGWLDLAAKRVAAPETQEVANG